MSSEYMIKGSTLKSKLAFVEEKFGTPALDAINEHIQANAEIFPLLTGAWYPFSLFIQTLRLIAQNHFDGNISKLVELGTYSAEKTLGSTYKSFIREGNFIAFMEDHTKLHNMFYNQGVTVTVAHEDSCGCDIYHRDKPIYDDADLYVGVGFYRRAAEMHGNKNVECSFTTSDDQAHFMMRWS